MQRRKTYTYNEETAEKTSREDGKAEAICMQQLQPGTGTHPQQVEKGNPGGVVAAAVYRC